ncbi:hypothetical protein, partial [Burkholderia ubonensis]|uniref:hypothetical protein n=1 Tax=Burkholderia ubonensis TaxID=101571 RepID=UPI001C4A3FBD
LPSEPRTFRVGAAQVEVPTIRSIEDAAGNEIQDTYSVVTPTVKLSGTASIRQQVQILDGGNEMATVRADDNGNWETTYLPVSTKRYSLRRGSRPLHRSRMPPATRFRTPTVW